MFIGKLYHIHYICLNTAYPFLQTRLSLTWSSSSLGTAETVYLSKHGCMSKAISPRQRIYVVGEFLCRAIVPCQRKEMLWNSKQAHNNLLSITTHYAHYNDVIMSVMASQITGNSIVYSTVYSGADQRKHQISASLAFVRGIHRWPVNSPHNRPVMRIVFPFHDVIMN